MRQRKYIFLSFFLLGLLPRLSYGDDSLAEFRQLYSKEIQAYDVLMRAVERMEGELVSAHEVFEHEQCDSVHFTNSPECIKAKAEIRRRSGLLLQKRRQLVVLKLKLKDYLQFTHGVIEDARAHLAGAENSSVKISSALMCLETLGALTWSTEINQLYSQGMKILRHQNQQKYFDHLKSLPGFSREECERDEQVECWQMESGIYYYVARGHIRISEGCLTRQAGVGRLDWSTFPTNPRDYLEAARKAGETVRPKKGCYTAINKEKAEGLAFYYETKRPRILCTPEREPEKKATGGGERCAYAYPHSFDLYLTAPNLCGGLARTIFHESMHAEGEIDNLETFSHNNGACRSFDAVYHCSYLCFPEKPRPDFFHQRGCESCVSEERAEALCSGLPDALGSNLQMCGVGR